MITVDTQMGQPRILVYKYQKHLGHWWGWKLSQDLWLYIFNKWHDKNK